MEALGHSLVGLWARPEGEGWRVRIAGGKLDARPYLERLQGESDKGPTVPITIEPSRIDEVVLPGGSLTSATVAGQRVHEGYLSLDLGADIVSPTARGRIDIKMEPDAQ
jgi:hypothetical protein